MKTIASGLLTHLQGEVLTTNTCVLITRTDGTKFGYTDCDLDLTVSGQVYKALTGAATTQNQTSDQFNVDHVEATSYLDATEMTEADLMAGKFDDAAVSMFQVNRNNIAAGIYHMRDGLLGQVTVNTPSEFVAELRGLMQYLQKQIGSLLSPTCRWTLGDMNSSGTVAGSHCTINLPSLAVTGVAVTSVTNNQAFHASSLGQPDGYFTAGFLTWTSGLNNGRSMDIQASALSGGSIVLQLPMLNSVQIGDTFTIYPGCQKRKTTDCIQKFSNVVNFGGFAEMPGIDSMIRPGGV